MASAIAKDLDTKGPIAWLDYFEPSHQFFMANDGNLVFPTYDYATLFIKNVLAKQISRVKLQWNDMKIDSLSPDLAMIRAGYHEELFDLAHKPMPADGYFTGLASRTSSGWKLRNLHWSSAQHQQ